MRHRAAIHTRLSHTDRLRTLMKAGLSVICMTYHGKQLNTLTTSMKSLKFGIKCSFQIVNKHAPLKSHRIKRKYQPDWLTPQIVDCIKEPDKCKLNGKMDEYRLLRNKVSTMIDTAKKEAYQTKVEEGKDDPRSIWKLSKQFGICKKGTSKVNNFEIKINNDII